MNPLVKVLVANSEDLNPVPEVTTDMVELEA